jgi:hypothetical protein
MAANINRFFTLMTVNRFVRCSVKLAFCSEIPTERTPALELER